jgi:hypothetical protein
LRFRKEAAGEAREDFLAEPRRHIDELLRKSKRRGHLEGMGVCPTRGVVKNDQRTDKSWEMEESMTWKLELR